MALVFVVETVTPATPLAAFEVHVEPERVPLAVVMLIVCAETPKAVSNRLKSKKNFFINIPFY